jgi:D-hexose-6-phosphate mutarotase
VKAGSRRIGTGRDGQFQHIAPMVTKFQRQQQPVISVDTKKKEAMGDFKNAGREWQPQGQPEQVWIASGAKRASALPA